MTTAIHILTQVEHAEEILQETVQQGDHIDSRLDTVEAHLKTAERDLRELLNPHSKP